MTIKEVYDQLSVPANLQRHMLLVAKVALFITKHWHGEKIQRQKLLLGCLLHDVGNIVKFNFREYPKYLEEEQNRLV